MMPTIQMRDVLKCRSRHAKLIRVWRQIPKASWLLALNAAALAAIGWSMVAKLDPDSKAFVTEAKSSAVVMGIALLASIAALIVAWRKP